VDLSCNSVIDAVGRVCHAVVDADGDVGLFHFALLSCESCLRLIG
jgi:hypothetical protein